ncbi:MAG: alpha/beta hydrolase [Planctomycetota bacterium]
MPGSQGREGSLFLEQALAQRGYGFARFDFRGHGNSSGGPRAAHHQPGAGRPAGGAEDARADGDGPERVILIGSSFGALISAWHCALEAGRVVGQLLLAPAFRMVARMLQSIGETGRERWQQLRSYHFVSPWVEFDLGYDLVTDSKRYLPERCRSAPALPTVIIHGSEDQSVPLRLSEESCPGLPGAAALAGARARRRSPAHAVERADPERGDRALAARALTPTIPSGTVGTAPGLNG